MGSPITFSGFNQIDFNVVLNAIMQQESLPLQALQAKQTALQATDSTVRSARHQARFAAHGVRRAVRFLDARPPTPRRSSDTTRADGLGVLERRRGPLRRHGQRAGARPGHGLQYLRPRHRHDHRRHRRQPDDRHRADRDLRAGHAPGSWRGDQRRRRLRRPARRSSRRRRASTAWC